MNKQQAVQVMIAQSLMDRTRKIECYEVLEAHHGKPFADSALCLTELILTNFKAMAAASNHIAPGSAQDKLFEAALDEAAAHATAAIAGICMLRYPDNEEKRRGACSAIDALVHGLLTSTMKVIEAAESARDNEGEQE